MLSELNHAKKFFTEKFGEGQPVPAATYAIPYQATRGKAFMRVKVDEEGKLSHFDLWWDEKMTKSYYLLNKVGGNYFPRS